MNKLRLLTAALLAAVLMPATSEARAFQPPTWTAALRGGGYTIPAEWAGVWQDDDSTYSCSPRVLLDTSSDTDTLCAGTFFGPDTTGGQEYDCTGSITSTTVDVTCSGSIAFEECTATFEYHFVGTRSGDTSVMTSTFSTTYTPSGCALLPDECEEIVTRSTRIAPEPPGCLTPTQTTTWGQLKTRYR